MGPEPLILAAMSSATVRAALSANAPARGTGASAQSPSAYTFGKGVARLRGQDLQLGEAENERIVLIDERDPHLIAQRVRQPGGQLQPAETGAEDQHLLCHHSSVVRGGTGLTPPVWPDKVACPASRCSSSQPDFMRSPAQV